MVGSDALRSCLFGRLCLERVASGIGIGFGFDSFHMHMDRCLKDESM